MSQINHSDIYSHRDSDLKIEMMLFRRRGIDVGQMQYNVAGPEFT